MTDALPVELPAKAVTLRYRVNAVLFAVLMVALTFWFERHLQVYVTQVVLIGGTMTLWALWQLLQSWLRWGLEPDTKGMAKKFFGRQQGTEYLVFGFVILLILFTTTSSLYLTYEGSGGGGEFRVEVDSEGQRVLPPALFSSSQKVAGQPYFLQLRGQQLELRILEPRGFLPLKKTLKPGERLDIKVPGNFSPKKFHVLRLVPGPYLYSNLPEYSDYPSVQYQVEISRAGTQGVTFQDMRRQSLYAGASADDMRWLLDKQQQGELLRSLTDALQAARVEEDAIAQIVPPLETNRTLLSTFEFAAGDQINVQISRRKEGVVTPLTNQTVSIAERDGAIRPILLEIPGGKPR